MRSVSFIVAGVLAIGTATAQAQTQGATGPYATFTTGATVGGAGGMFGTDLGWRLNLSWDVFLEGGRMLNTKMAEMDTAAAVVAQYLAAVSGKTASAADVRQPANYFSAGIRYKFPTTGRVQPYAALGIGGGKVERRASFLVDGTDVTVQLPGVPYHVVLGGDLSGSEIGTFFAFGGGAQFDLRGRFFADASYRFGRFFLADGGVNTNRLQFGIGARF